MKWSILIATLSERQEKLVSLLCTLLLPQAEAAGDVEVVALYNNGEYPLQDIRQALLDDARGQWVSFVDDDDLVEPDYIPAVINCLYRDPDYVAFRHALYWGEHLDPRPVVTGLGLGWCDTHDYYIRDVTHINPARTALARQAGFRQLVQGYEDRGYVTRLRPLLKTQISISRVLYHYRQSMLNPLAYQPSGPVRPRPVIDSPYFRWHPWSTGS